MSPRSAGEWGGRIAVLGRRIFLYKPELDEASAAEDEEQS